jgi:hypothetical protein
MVAEFCECGSLKVNGKCTNRKRNCPNGTKMVRVDFKKQGYLRDRRTGALIDKETGEALITTRTGVKRHGFAR